MISDRMLLCTNPVRLGTKEEIFGQIIGDANSCKLDVNISFLLLAPFPAKNCFSFEYLVFVQRT